MILSLSGRNPSAPTKKARQRAILRAPYAKELLYRAERHLEENPAGHVAFGCRLGQDRSPALAQELNRRMTVKAHGEAAAALLALWTKESA